MSRIASQKIEKFLEDLSSLSPTPGGGAVAALAGAMAASLVEMVANLTLGKEKYQKVQKEIRRLALDAAKKEKVFLTLADEDVKAYNFVMAAYRLSKEDASRKKKIKKALTYAMEVPEKTAELAEEVEKLAKKVAKIGNKNAYSDARSAFFLAQAAGKSAQENVKINKASLASLK